MTAKQDAESKITAASKGCAAAETEWRAAATAINGSISANGYGVHHDSTELRSKLLDARDHINKSLAILNDSDWPSTADYNLA